MLDLLDRVIATVGPLAFLVLGGAAAVEYVLPPFPGDTVVLLGGVYAVRGQQPWLLVLAAVTAGSILGAAVNYRIGRFIDVRLERRLERKTFLGISLEQLLRVEQKMRQRGAWLLLFNRFIPGIRGLLFVAAGMANMPLHRVLVLGGVSALAHALLLMGVGIAVGGNAERLEALANQYQNAVWGLLAVAALGLTVRLAVRIALRRRAARAPEA